MTSPSHSRQCTVPGARRHRHLRAALLLLVLSLPFAAMALGGTGWAQEPQPPAPTQTPTPAGEPATAAPAPTATTTAEPAAQAPASARAPSEAAPAAVPAATPGATPAVVSDALPKTKSEEPGEISEEQLKQQLVGKPLILRGGYLGDSLSFNEHGDPTGHPSVGSYTLSGVQIDKVRLSKHKVELEGARYALHFLGALPNEDPSAGVDRVKITPKKKVLKISIDREQILKPKKEKEVKEKVKKPAPGAVVPTGASSASADAATPPEPTEAEQAKAEMAATPEAERPADVASVTTTTSPGHANQVLRQALDRVFAPGLDEELRAHLPQFWQLYYQSQAAGVDYRPADPGVLRSNAVDQQARLLSSINPESNDIAQANGIAGRSLYRVVIGADGKPGEIAVVRPIGFGLDENAVAAIRKATFQPAMKGGQPAAEALDLVVMFRIYSKRTSAAASQPAEGEVTQAKPIKPGPYSVKEP